VARIPLPTSRRLPQRALKPRPPRRGLGHLRKCRTRTIPTRGLALKTAMGIRQRRNPPIPPTARSQAQPRRTSRIAKCRQTRRNSQNEVLDKPLPNHHQRLLEQPDQRPPTRWRSRRRCLALYPRRHINALGSFRLTDPVSPLREQIKITPLARCIRRRIAPCHPYDPCHHG
jgi:hypothetical protein